MAEEQLIYPAPFSNGITVEKFKAFLEEEAEKTNVPFDNMIAALYEGGMIDDRTWELLGT